MVIPALTQSEKIKGLEQAKLSPRHRFPKILHGQGDYFNEVFNFFYPQSYMQPHLHPGEEKIEYIHIVDGKVVVIFFNNQGDIVEKRTISQKHNPYVRVPAFTWHTYVVLSETAITYETMEGVYDPKMWKQYASWAPKEDDKTANKYLFNLKSCVLEDLKDSHLIKNIINDS